MKNIYQRLNDVRQEVVYLKRGSAGQGTGVLYDEVVALARKAIVEQGIIVTTDFLADTSRTVTTSSGKENYVYEAFIRVWYINMDDPADKFFTDIVAHAMDSGDKAPGKAVTYATKTSLVKVLFLETGINDESRSPNQNDYTDDQFGEYHDLIANEEALKLFFFTTSVPENTQIALHNSFEKGKISKGKEIARGLISKGAEEYNSLIDTLEEMAKNQDVAITEELEGMPDYARKMIGKAVSKETLDFIKKCFDEQK